MKNSIIKDVGILTWHYYNNVGSALQAYALYTYIRKIGYTCEFINYRKFTDKNFFYKVIRDICINVTDIFPNLLPETLRFRIYAFQKHYFKESELIKNNNDLERTNDRYKCFVCGSDQIWAPSILDEVYLFSFVRSDKYRFSYAASIGLNDIPEDLKEVYKQNLERFDSIGVREEQGTLLLKQFIDKPVSTVLDPTFLVTKEEWEFLADKSVEQKYIFCYFLGDSEKYIKEIEYFSKKNNWKVIRYEPNEKRRKGIKKYMGPEEFLAYIKNSNLVITDSFHGVALSINLEKNFYVVKRFDDRDEVCQNSRVVNILNITGLENRLLEDFILIDENINFERVNERLNVEKKNSMEYLHFCLKKGTME